MKGELICSRVFALSRQQWSRNPRGYFLDVRFFVLLGRAFSWVIAVAACVYRKPHPVLIGGGNHLTSAHNDRNAMFCLGLSLS
jgi:hypothetical protein